MNGIAQVGVPLPIGVTFESGLSFVAAKVYDVSGAPALLATVPLSNYDGSSYTGNYTPLSTGPIAINKSVYTDGTYTVVDNAFSQGDDSIQVVDFTMPVVVFKTLPIVSVTAVINGVPTFDAELEQASAIIAELNEPPTLVAIITD